MKLSYYITTFLIFYMFMGGASAAITYNAPNNMITVTGYTEATPCTFTDLYNADVAGGWGVVFVQGGNQFYITARLRIGDDSTPTWFADLDKHIIIDTTPFSYWWGYRIRIYQNAHFRLGRLTGDGSYKTSTHGCCLRFLQGGGIITGDQNFQNVDTGSLELYSSQIAADSYSYIYGFSNSTIYDCIFIKNIELNRLDPTDMNRVSISNVRYGIVLINGTLSNIVCSNIYDYGLYYHTACGEMTMTDCSFINTSKTIFGQGDAQWIPGNLTLIDIVSDKWELGYYKFGGKIYRQYTFNLQTTPNANITIMNHTEILYQDYAYDNGSIPEQTFSIGHYRRVTGDTLNSENPYTIEISKPGYQTYTHIFNLTEPVIWEIALKPDVFTIPETKSITGLGFLIMSLFGCVGLIIFRNKQGDKK